MSIERNRDRFNVKGGGKLYTMIVSSGGAATLTDLGYIQETDFTIDAKMESYVDERGFVVNQISGGEEWHLKPTLMQVGKDEIELIMTYISSYRSFYYQVLLSNGYYQELFIPLAKIVNTLELKFAASTKRLIPLDIVALMPKAAVTVAPTDYNVAVNKYGVLLENSEAKGVPTSTGGNMYTACV